MKYTVEAFVGLALFSLLVDYFLYRLIHEHDEERPAIFSFPSGPFWFYSMPVLFIFTFLIYLIAIPIATGPAVYVQFQWLLTVYLLIYIPKFFYVVGYRLTHRVVKVKEKFTPEGKIKRMNDGRYPKITRKKFLSQVGIMLASAPFVSLLFGVMKGRFNFSTKYTKLTFPNLPDAFDGMKIVQISDIHLGSLNFNYSEMETAVEIINAEHPDMICFTGDLVNNFYEETIGWEKVFGKLKAKMGKFSILGNHDYGDYSHWESEEEKQANLKGIIDAHKRLGFHILNNENVVVEHDGDKLAVVGVENWGHDPFPKYGDLNKAGQGVEDMPFKLLLSHDPDHWDAEVVGKTDYDLMLAGHTHGMQFGIEYKNFQWSPAKYKFKQWSGLYKKGHQFLYVNRGLGFLGMPARVGMPPEITVIELAKGPVSNEPM